MAIRVLVVDDSMVCREVLSELLNQAPDIQVVSTASSGKEAIALNRKLHPDIITMDVQMPGLDGFAAVEEIMATTPTPILVVTDSPVHHGVDRTFQALQVGALDLVQKPALDGDLAESLRQKIRLLAGVRVVQRKRRKVPRPTRKHTNFIGHRRTIVAITSSTGGPKVLLEILGSMPRDFASSILVTQHIPDGFSTGFANWLDSELALDVAEARDGEKLRSGRVFIAPTGYHLILQSPGVVSLSDDPPFSSHRPSGTKMFQSLAQMCGPEAIGIVLSGMGSDGAEGLLELRRAGGLCLAQDESSSLVFGMPKAAIDLKAVDKVLDVAGLTDFLLRFGG